MSSNVASLPYCENLLLSQRTKGIVRNIVPRSVRNWVRSPRKSVEWLWDSLSFSFGATKELALLPDWRVICHPRVHKVFSFSQLTDPDQSEEFRNFVRYCDPSRCLFDIGASYGAFSLVAAHFGGTAIAVEPSPIATRFIRVECQLNGFEKNIKIVEACASDGIGEVEMLCSGVFFRWLFSNEFRAIQQGADEDEGGHYRPVSRTIRPANTYQDRCGGI
jgi:hypothetical protein